MASKSNKGRQKLEMKKIHNEGNLQVTFSKRRAGLFKKASELCTLCGAEVVIIVFSPGNRVFTFGHPNVETLIERFLSGKAPKPNRARCFNEVNRELNMQITQGLKTVEVARKRGQELDKMRKESQAKNWFDKPLEELTLEQLQQLRAALEEMMQCLSRQKENLIIQNSIEQQQPPPPQQHMVAPTQQRQYYMGHPGASSSSVPSSSGGLGHPGASSSYDAPGGFNPNMKLTINQLNMDISQLNINQMMPPPPPPPPSGFYNPGFGHGFY